MLLARRHQGRRRRLQGRERVHAQRAGAGGARRRRAHRGRLPRADRRAPRGLLQRGGGEREGRGQHDRRDRHPHGERPGEGQGAARRPHGRAPHPPSVPGGRPPCPRYAGEPRRPAPGRRLLDRARPGAAPCRQHPRHPRLQPRGARARALQPRLGPHDHDPGGPPARRARDRPRGGHDGLRALPRRQPAHHRRGAGGRLASDQRPQHRPPAHRGPGGEAQAALRPRHRAGPGQGRQGLARRQLLHRRPPVSPPGDRADHRGAHLGAAGGREEEARLVVLPRDLRRRRRPYGWHRQARRHRRDRREGLRRPRPSRRDALLGRREPPRPRQQHRPRPALLRRQRPARARAHRPPPRRLPCQREAALCEQLLPARPAIFHPTPRLRPWT